MESASTSRLPNLGLMLVPTWVALVSTLALSGALATALPLIPVLMGVALGGTLIAWRRSARLRAWGESIDLRVLIGVHVVRLVIGLLFLVQLAAGQLPALFATRAGVGDILTGALALVALVAAGSASSRGTLRGWRRATILGFSIIGLVDFLIVVATAQVTIFIDHEPLLTAKMVQLPYAFLPLVIVPSLLLTHLLVLARMRRPRPCHAVTG